ncbi:MAG: hypothetical protein ACREQQ_14975 [Candidatus Binatia bacterium]
MADTEHKSDLGYEPTDADVSTLLGWGVGLVVVLLLSVLVTFIMFRLLAARATRYDIEHPALPLAAADNQIPPEPRLQVIEPEDLAVVLAEEDELLDGYGWVDKEKGTVRIPIERAMELVIKEGLPMRPQTKKAP